MLFLRSIVTCFPEPFTILKNLEAPLALSHRLSIVHVLDLVVLAVREVLGVSLVLLPVVPHPEIFVLDILFVFISLTITSITRTFTVLCLLCVGLFLVSSLFLIKLYTRIALLSRLAITVA